MTPRQIMQAADEFLLATVVLFVLLPLTAWVLGFLHGKGNGGKSPWKYLYSLLVYGVTVPGIFAIMFCAYTLFFTDDNLLDVSLTCYVLPMVSMIATLVLIRRNVSLELVPGFERL